MGDTWLEIQKVVAGLSGIASPILSAVGAGLTAGQTPDPVCYNERMAAMASYVGLTLKEKQEAAAKACPPKDGQIVTAVGQGLASGLPPSGYSGYMTVQGQMPGSMPALPPGYPGSIPLAGGIPSQAANYWPYIGIGMGALVVSILFVKAMRK